MARKWSELSEPSRWLIVGAGVVDGLLRVAAVADLLRRPAEQVRGSRRAWMTVMLVVNSIGAVPMAYFLLGRRKSSSD
ncbi:DUF5652 family protein [Nocardia sp. NPDC101769]|uniref:DUF5652 family protein n=1 Tax=Nocardia sp. NPDC101769 TaxID=3364333 RepID=UPI003826A85A